MACPECDNGWRIVGGKAVRCECRGYSSTVPSLGSEDVFGWKSPEILPSMGNREHQLERLAPESGVESHPANNGSHEIAWVLRLMAQFGLPYRPLPFGENEWIRRNGNLECRIVNVSGQGIAYGSIPRLMMAWLSDWHIRHPDDEVVELGRNISRFMRVELRLNVTGGAKGNLRSVRQQLLQLFGTTLSVSAVNPADPACAPFIFEQCPIARKIILWGPSQSEDDAFFPSVIELDAQFCKSILAHHIPVRRDAFLSLARWPLALDLYMWCAYRFYTLKRSTLVTWDQLTEQFGTRCAATRQGRSDFRQQVRQQLARVRQVYPEARVEMPSDGRGLLLHPSQLPIAPTRVFSLPSRA
jgi:hypothetical protein